MKVDVGLYATGFGVKDGHYDKMKAAYWACIEAGVPIPMEVNFYFNNKQPTDDELMEVELGDALSFSSEHDNPACITENLVINIAELPKNVDVIVINAHGKVAE